MRQDGVTVNQDDQLALRFEENRPHLRAVAYRMLGSLAEADDAVQETWLRLGRADAAGVHNLGGWLTTVVARVSLDMLRSRRSRREEPLPVVAGAAEAADPEQEAVLADSVGLALLVVLDTLDPPERLAFVLHDMFAVPFDEIAPIVGRTPTAARQLASRARRRVQGNAAVPEADLNRQRRVVDAFLAASRDGDFDALLAVLDPDVVLHADRGPRGVGGPIEVRGSASVAGSALAGGRAGRGGQVRPALVNGEVGLVITRRGRLFTVLAFTIEGDRIVAIDAVTTPSRLSALDIAVLDPPA
jgi:RNA polymerase sigma factor (sigma-70 family)